MKWGKKKKPLGGIHYLICQVEKNEFLFKMTLVGTMVKTPNPFK